MTWTLFSLSIGEVGGGRRGWSLADPLHVAVDGDLAHLDDLAALDHDEPSPVGRPMVLARERKRRGDAPRVEILQALERLPDRLPGGVRPGPLDRLHGE